MTANKRSGGRVSKAFWIAVIKYRVFGFTDQCPFIRSNAADTQSEILYETHRDSEALVEGYPDGQRGGDEHEC